MIYLLEAIIDEGINGYYCRVVWWAKNTSGVRNVPLTGCRIFVGLQERITGLSKERERKITERGDTDQLIE